MRTYSWKTGSRISLDAQKVGERLRELEKKHGTVTPETIVKEAKKKRSPLHNLYTWDNEDEAHLYRLERARLLLRSLEVEVVNVKVESQITQPRQVFVHLKSRSGYVDMARAMSDEDLRKEVLFQAKKDLQAVKKKYQQYKEIAAVFEAAEEALSKVA